MTDKEKAKIIARIRGLQQTRDYAAPEYVPTLTREIERLLRLLEKGSK